MEESHWSSQKGNEDDSLSSSSTLSPSSSSSSSTSCYRGAVVALEWSLHRPENRGMLEDIQRLRFVGDTSWGDVESRFDRLSTPRNQLEPAVKWTDFVYCIGMQQSPEFANELLRALRGVREWKQPIIKKQLHDYWLCLTNPSFEGRAQLFFDMLDRDMDGRVTEKDLKQAILVSASANKIWMTREDAESHASLIMESEDTENRGYIEASQLGRLLRASLAECSPTTPPRREDRRSPRAEMMLRSRWRRAWVISLWAVACAALFTWKFVQYRHRKAFQVMGYCLSTAKGAAETLKLNMALILLPVSRNTITWLRSHRRLTSFVPFNDNINFHKLVAGGIVIGVILHGGTHLACDFPRISASNSSVFQQTIAARFGYRQPSYIQILDTTEVVTGIAMVVLMAVAFSLATRWPRRQSPSLPRSVRKFTGYNTFWYSHHLFILVYVLLIVHSMFLFLTDSLVEKTTWMYIAIPVLLYAGERIFRAVRSGLYEVKILKAHIYPGKVLSLKLPKPDGFSHRSGMYVFIQCPQISPFEWHPFSLTSGPRDELLSLHIRSLGDWSYQLHGLFQEATLTRANWYPKIYIDGPYGAASQDHVKYDVIMMVGLGIGATPFISILKDIATSFQTLNNHNADYEECACSARRPLKAYFYWVTREQSSFEWFKDVMKEIAPTNQKQTEVEVFNFLTSAHQEGDARSALISVIQALCFAKHRIDIVSQTPVHTYFGRPNWFSIFSKMAQRHRGTRIGVFYCGPSGVASELEKLCTKFSTTTITRFVFHKENY